MHRKSFWLIGLLLVLVLAVACSPAVPTVAPTSAPGSTVAASPTSTTVESPTEAPTSTPGSTVTASPTSTTVESPEAGSLPEVNPLEVTGDIVTAGSSTVFPLSEAIAEMFRDEGYAGNITIDSIGSGAGFERFCTTGETDIANASRAIKTSEVEACNAIGREPIEFRVGTDALAIVVSKANDFLTDVSIDQLAKIFSSTAVKWSDVDPSWPEEDILRFSPGTDSGTFDFFVEEVLGNEKELLLDAANVQLSEDDNVLVQGVLGSPYAIGYFGYAYYQENADTLKALSINGVTPNKEHVDDGTYPLARPLFIYSTAKIMQEKPQVAAFINYYLTNVNSVIARVGYFPASEQALAEARNAWLLAVNQ